MSDEEAKALPVIVESVMLEAPGNSTWTTDPDLSTYWLT
jgi:hypothetical protein